MSDSIQSAMIEAFNGVVSPIPTDEKRRMKITCIPGSKTASQLMAEYPTLSRSAAFRMVKTGWAMLNYQVREVNPADMRTITQDDIDAYGEYAGKVFSSHFQGFYHMREDLIQEGITRILELTGKSTDPNYLMRSAQLAMYNFLASHRAIRFSGTFEGYDDINVYFHGHYGGDPLEKIENMTFAELRDSRTHEPIPEGIRAWSAM